MIFRKFFAHFVTKGIFIIFAMLYLVYISYTFFPLMDMVIELVKPLSWILKFPIFLLFGLISTPICLAGGLPLLWLDKKSKQPDSWLGRLNNELKK